MHEKKYKFTFMNSVGSDHLVYLLSLIRVYTNRQNLLTSLCTLYVICIYTVHKRQHLPFLTHWLNYHFRGVVAGVPFLRERGDQDSNPSRVIPNTLKIAYLTLWVAGIAL